MKKRFFVSDMADCYKNSVGKDGTECLKTIKV